MDCNMNNGMNCGMNRNRMNQNGMNCGMNRNGMNRNMNERQMRNSMPQNRQGCGCGNNMMRENRGNNMARGNQRDNNMSRGNCGCKHEKDEHDGCMKMDGCDIGKEHVDHMAPGMAYVPWQKWEDVYCMEKGLERGTIFEQLDKPFLGGRGK